MSTAQEVWLTGCPSCGMNSCDCDEGTWNPQAQRTWVGLTDEEIAEQDWRLSADRTYEQWTLQEQLVVCGVKDFARAIEAKLKEKNNG